MSDSVMAEGTDDDVLELVLSSDEEFPGDRPAARGEDEGRRVWWRETAARFLPGVDAGALYAMAFAMLSIVTAVLAETWAQNRELAAEVKAQYAPLASSSSGAGTRDPLAGFRGVAEFKALLQGGVAVVAILVAVAVLLRWHESRHARWSRPAAQAALGIGILGLAFAVLLYTRVVGALPSVHDIRDMQDAYRNQLGGNG